MMLLRSTSRLFRRLAPAILIVATLLPTATSVTRAQDDEPPLPDVSVPTMAPSQPAPTFTPNPAPTLNPAPTSTPRPPASSQPASKPVQSADPGDETEIPGQNGLATCPRPSQVEPTDWRLDGDPNLTQMRMAIGNTLKDVEVSERGLTGQIVGFRAGALYAHIYARDSATIAPGAQYFYDLPYLTRPTEEFLALQYDGEPGDAEDAYWKTPAQRGAVSGTVGGGEIAGAKMLVVSDEEPSVVNMAYVAVKAGAGASWLKQTQAGKTRIQRLNEAMDWLFEKRFDQPRRLIKRGNTTDWGDVAVGQGSTSGSFTKEPDEWTASIYDQAWTFRALQQLAEMNKMVDRPDIAERQLQRARLLRQATVEQLWQGNRGYFRTRIALPPLQRTVDEDNIVSIANGIAVYAGITDPSERSPIFQSLERARLEARAPKPGLTLWPAYPLGFFDYPQMVPGRYQNGAVWDWWGGMQISAEFWTGYSSLGRAHLSQVAADWAREPGEVYEWQETGSARNNGSQDYAGAASTMTEAIVTGLYGVDIGPERWGITSRLGAQSGGIHVFHPTTGCVVNYWHTYAGDRVAIEWETTHPKSGEVRVVLPENVKVDGALLDQQAVKLATDILGEDVIAVLPTPAPAGKHRLELQLSEAGN